MPFTRMTGYTAAEALGQNSRLLKSGRQDPQVYQELWNAVQAGRVWHGELVNKRKDGTLYTEEMTITPVRNGAGVVEHFIAIKQDVTARKQAEQTVADTNRQLAEALRQLRTAQQQLVEQERLSALGQMASGIAHDFNNALTPIAGFADILLQHPEQNCRPTTCAALPGHDQGLRPTGHASRAPVARVLPAPRSRAKCSCRWNSIH